MQSISERRYEKIMQRIRAIRARGIIPQVQTIKKIILRKKYEVVNDEIMEIKEDWTYIPYEYWTPVKVSKKS